MPARNSNRGGRSSRIKKPVDSRRIEDILKADLEAAGLCTKHSKWEREYVPFNARKWRVDLFMEVPYANHQSLKIVVEIHGDFHIRQSKFRKDCAKLNALTAAGYTCFVYPASSVKTAKRRARIVEQISRFVNGVVDTEADSCVLVGD